VKDEGKYMIRSVWSGHERRKTINTDEHTTKEKEEKKQKRDQKTITC